MHGRWRRSRLHAVASVLAVGALSVACGANGGASAGDEPHDVKATVVDAVGPIAATATTCTFDGDRQVTAQGVIRSTGEGLQYVSVSVRFVDADGVRVDIGTDSISDLKPHESARWDASIYADGGSTVVSCEVTPVAESR